jgi:quercetin dioxygenase-like cupin family protein
VRLLRAEEIDTLAAVEPAAEPGLAVTWLAGPVNAEPLDVGLVTLAPGAVTPLHSHDGGQVIVVVSGRGWVETAGHRVEVGPGDVVVTPPDESHTHGAADDGPMAHFTVTTGPNQFPARG